jgi:hypothetical protein
MCRSALVAAILLLTSCGSNSTAVVGDAASVELSADSIDFSSLNATTDLNAVARDAGGTVLSANIAWTTGSSAVATVSNAGVVTAQGNGVTNVIATTGTVADTAIVTVQQVAATLTLSPDTLRLGSVGDTATIGRTVRDAGGSTMTGVPVTFATVNPSVATVVVATGRVTAEANGATTITAQVAPGGANLTKSIRVEVGGSLAPAYLVGGYVGTAYTDQVGPANGAGGAFTYSITAGALPNGLAISSSTAQITGMPSAPGVFFFEVQATNGTLTLSERFAITISTKASSAFNLFVSYNGGLLPHPNARTALSGALARLENIITGDAGTTSTYPPTGLTPTQCQLIDASLLNGAVIEDIAILMSIGPMDGPSNTLARAGPCGYGRQTLPAVISGQLKIDEADASGSVAFLQEIILHEIGHVLGIGTLWFDSTTGVGTPTVRYSGTNGVAEWTTLGGAAGGVPLEPDIGAHWHEAVFNGEIMTPQAEGPGTPQPFSRLTIGTLLDLGFGAVLGQADAYTLPGCSPACTAPARSSGESERMPDYVIERLIPLPPAR